MREETQSFVVRIWREVVDGQGKTVVWRGSIDHVGANKRLYFADLDAVVRFIRQQAGMAARSRHGRAGVWTRVRGWIAKEREE
jgi:hypothetical protein